MGKREKEGGGGRRKESRGLTEGENDLRHFVVLDVTPSLASPDNVLKLKAMLKVVFPKSRILSYPGKPLQPCQISANGQSFDCFYFLSHS